jgi:predicted transcriptional regulator
MDDIRTIRRELGMTQTELAEALGVSQGTVSRMEAGDIPVNKRTALALRALRAAKPESAAA